MRRDRVLESRILRAIEALPSGQHVLKMKGENEQDVLEHLGLLEEQKLIRATVHRVRGVVDLVSVSGLTAAGHDRLEAEAGQVGVAQVPFTAEPYSSDVTRDPAGAPHPGRFQGVSARGMAAGEGLAGGAGAILSEDGSPLLTEDGTPILSEDADEPIRPSSWGTSWGNLQVGNFATPVDPSRLSLGGLPLTLGAEPLALAAARDRPELVHETLVARIAVLEIAIQEIRKPGMGHNRPPPDDMAAFAPLAPSDFDEIDRLITLLKDQPPVPAVVAPEIVIQAQKVMRIGAKIAELADIYAKEAVKSAGQETGKRLVQLPFWLGLTTAISGVAAALQTWLSVLPH